MQRWSIHLAICLSQTRRFGARMLLALAALFIQSAIHHTIEIDVVDGQETLVQTQADEAIIRSAPNGRRNYKRSSEADNSGLHCSSSLLVVRQRRLDATKNIRRLLNGGDHSNRNGLGSALLI